MNALVGQEAKVRFSLFGGLRKPGADDGGRKDGGDLAARSRGDIDSGRVGLAVIFVLHSGGPDRQG
jgi:hypothetical protein